VLSIPSFTCLNLAGHTYLDICLQNYRAEGTKNKNWSIKYTNKKKRIISSIARIAAQTVREGGIADASIPNARDQAQCCRRRGAQVGSKWPISMYEPIDSQILLACLDFGMVKIDSKPKEPIM
jgi:hypothetical protein